jgi:hypothetical protein
MKTLELLRYYHYYDVHHCFIRSTIIHHGELISQKLNMSVLYISLPEIVGCLLCNNVNHHVELMKSEYLRQLVALIYDGDILRSNEFSFHTHLKAPNFKAKPYPPCFQSPIYIIILTLTKPRS